MEPKKPTLNIRGTNSAFPGCCGATVLHGLSTSAEAGAVHATKPETAQFATTSPNQPSEVIALKAAKFRPVLSWINKNTGNRVTLWVRGDVTISQIVPE